VKSAELLAIHTYDYGMDVAANQWHLARFAALLSAVSVSIDAVIAEDRCCATKMSSMASSVKGV
jgi:hypothetical protein